jgi:hypothetical protein
MGIEFQVIESKLLMRNVEARSAKKGDPPYSGKSHYVDENKCCKNVRFEACHYVDENKAT